MLIFKTYCPSSANSPAQTREEEPIADQAVEFWGGFSSIRTESFSVKCNPAFGSHCNPASYVREGGVGLIHSSLASRKTQCSNLSWMYKDEVKEDFYFLFFEWLKNAGVDSGPVKKPRTQGVENFYGIHKILCFTRKKNLISYSLFSR